MIQQFDVAKYDDYQFENKLFYIVQTIECGFWFLLVAQRTRKRMQKNKYILPTDSLS
jgi:hypothetical protein